MLYDFALAIAPVFNPTDTDPFGTMPSQSDEATFISLTPHTEVPTLLEPPVRRMRGQQPPLDEEARVYDMRRVLAGRMASRRELALSIERAMTDAELAQPISVPDTVVVPFLR